MRNTVLAVLMIAGCEVGGGAADDLELSPIEPSPPFDGDPTRSAVFGVDLSHHEGPMSQREMDCFWDSGVRHVIVGTQVEEITRQQLAMAVARGMTVDAYVYLYGHEDPGEQVARAFARAGDQPIERMWLDVEEPAFTAAHLEAALEACRADGGALCGIYTGEGFWNQYMRTTRFADAPLWYARYNGRRLLSDWESERFGGWSEPTGKQWAEEALCGVGVDKDTIQVEGPAAVTVDRSLPPDDGLPPPAPEGLHPADGAVVGVDYLKLMVGTVPRAIRYELALERWQSGRFALWTVFAATEPFKKVYPARNAIYRFRARAENLHGWGSWSPWVVFEYGVAP